MKDIMAKLSAESYKGTRDFYPEDMRVRNYIFGIWRKVMQRHGYDQYDAPLLEPLEVYAAKSGQELVNEQTYQFVDRGDRNVAIRPEMTPSVSRMIAKKRQEIAYPARWFSIAQYMRYERPQRGREREFWQLNADIFGVDDVRADAEIIILGYEILKEFGARDDMYKIRINDRDLIHETMTSYLGLDPVQSEMMVKLFDRKGKISHEDFRDQAIEIFGLEKAALGLQKIAALLGAGSLQDLPQELRSSPTVVKLQQLFQILTQNGVKNAVFDVGIMRGLDYYTGTVFEFFDTHPDNNRALFGGGRYDGLVGLFGAEPMSAIGFAPGLTMTELFLDVHDLLPKLSSTTDVYLAVLEGAESGANELASRLRTEGVRVELDITGRKADKQLKTALKKQIPFIAFVGENEVASQQYTVKDLAKGSEETVSFERMVAVVSDRRRHAGDDDDFVV